MSGSMQEQMEREPSSATEHNVSTERLVAAVEELSLNPQALEYVPPQQFTASFNFAPSLIHNGTSAVHPQLYVPQFPPGAIWPFVGCMPMSLEDARFGWVPPGVSPTFGSPLPFIPPNCSYGYSGDSTGQAIHKSNFTGFSSAGYAASMPGSHLRRHPPIPHDRQPRPSSCSSNAAAPARRAAAYGDEMRSRWGARLHSLEGKQLRAGQPTTQLAPVNACSADYDGDSRSAHSMLAETHSSMGAGSTLFKVSSGLGGKRSGRRGVEYRPRPMSQGDVQAHVERTVYICDVEKSVTEEMLAQVFSECGAILDVRVCGDAHQDLRFAFLEFQDLQSVDEALQMSGREVAGYPLRISRSKTAINPVNVSYLPRSTAEREQCSRTIYVSNLDKSVDLEQLRNWFQRFAGPVSALRMKSAVQQLRTKIAFVELENAADAAKILVEGSGSLLGAPITTFSD